MDKEVLREIWYGQLPLCFKLHPDDVSGMHRPEPYYMMVSRVTYFPLILDKVIKYFNRFMDQSKQTSSDMWLDYDGQPIKWHHPVGLSWDLFGSNYDLPWKLILHFSEFPAKELVRCNTKTSIETNFMSSIKEADALKHKGAVIKNMVRKDHNQLWSSLVNDKFDQFWLVNKRLIERLDNELFRYIPFRLYLPDYTYVQKAIRPCTTERQIFQNTEKLSAGISTTNNPSIPVVYEYDTDIVIGKTHKCGHTAMEEEGEVKETSSVHRCSTMLDLIQISFANRLNDLLLTKQSPRGTNDQRENEDEGENDDEDNPEEASKDTKDDLIDVKLFKYRFKSHGIEIPFDTPLQWLSENFSYPDNFLHICAVSKENTECS